MLHPAIPEKFKLIYEILYYYKIDVEELASLTADRIIKEENLAGIQQGIRLSNEKFISLPDDLFNRITNFLEFNEKDWGNIESKFSGTRSLKLNYVFESNKRGHQYTIPTLYKKFKEHCLKVGILRDLALGSLINTDLGRFISIINSELVKSKEKLIVSFFSFESEMPSSILRYYIVHLNYEEITGFEKEKVSYGYKEIFTYSNLEIVIHSFISNSNQNEDLYQGEIEFSKAIFVYGKPDQVNSSFMIKLISLIFDQGENKFISFAIDDQKLIIQKELETILNSTFRPWIHYIPMHEKELRNIDILTTIEEFFLFILEKFNLPNNKQLENQQEIEK